MSWEMYFLVWAVLSVGGAVFCAIASFWPLFVVFIASLILCLVFYTITKMMSDAGERHSEQSRYNSKEYENMMLRQGYEIIEERLGYQLWDKKDNRNNLRSPIETNSSNVLKHQELNNDNL